MEESKVSIVEMELDSPLLEELLALEQVVFDHLDVEEPESLFCAALLETFVLYELPWCRKIWR